MYRIVPKRACVGSQRISKKYFLSLLPSYPDTQYVIDVATGNKLRIDSLETVAKRSELRNGIYSKKYLPIEQSYPKKLLDGLKDDEWEIKSFNSLTREVCFLIKAPSTIGKSIQQNRDKNFSYIIPNIP